MIKKIFLESSIKHNIDYFMRNFFKNEKIKDEFFDYYKDIPEIKNARNEDKKLLDFQILNEAFEKYVYEEKKKEIKAINNSEKCNVFISFWSKIIIAFLLLPKRGGIDCLEKIKEDFGVIVELFFTLYKVYEKKRSRGEKNIFLDRISDNLRNDTEYNDIISRLKFNDNEFEDKLFKYINPFEQIKKGRSADFISLMINLKDEFKIEIEDAETKEKLADKYKIKTGGKLNDYVYEKYKSKISMLSNDGRKILDFLLDRLNIRNDEFDDLPEYMKNYILTPFTPYPERDLLVNKNPSNPKRKEYVNKVLNKDPSTIKVMCDDDEWRIILIKDSNAILILAGAHIDSNEFERYFGVKGKEEVRPKLMELTNSSDCNTNFCWWCISGWDNSSDNHAKYYGPWYTIIYNKKRKRKWMLVSNEKTFDFKPESDADINFYKLRDKNIFASADKKYKDILLDCIYWMEKRAFEGKTVDNLI